MTNIQTLQAIFTLEADNFRILHWKACGKNFDSAHKIAGDYYEMVGNDIDDIAEIMLRDGINPLSIFECVNCLENAEQTVTSIDANNDYTKEDIIDYSNDILGILVRAIGVILNDYQESIGIKSYFEGLYEKYDKEWRYLNSRRMK